MPAHAGELAADDSRDAASQGPHEANTGADQATDAVQVSKPTFALSAILICCPAALAYKLAITS